VPKLANEHFDVSTIIYDEVYSPKNSSLHISYTTVIIIIIIKQIAICQPIGESQAQTVTSVY